VNDKICRYSKASWQCNSEYPCVTCKRDKRIKELDVVLKEFSEQHLTSEMVDIEIIHADFEGAYDEFILKARAALETGESKSINVQIWEVHKKRFEQEAGK
jgi:hypothetical protein